MSQSRISRRTFARGLAAAAAACAAGPSEEAFAVPENKKVRIGVVGGGFGAHFHWHEHPACIVEAVSDLRPDRRRRLQQVYKCKKAYPSLEELIKDPKVQAVAVVTEAPNHVRHCTAVMQAGKHALSAVPAGLTLEECAQLLEVKKRTGMKYMMAETSVWRWPTITARRFYEEGQFGELVYSEVEYYHPMSERARRSLWYYAGKRTWRYGYPPMLYPTHCLGFVVGVTGERMVSVSCLGWGRRGDPALKDNAYGNPFTDQVALFRTDKGHIVRCNIFWDVAAHGERAQWFGTDMSFYMPSSGGQPYMVYHKSKGRITVQPNYWHLVPPRMRYDSGHGGSHPFITHEFISAILEDREPAVNIYEALAMTVPGIVAYKSSFKGGEAMKIENLQ